MGFLNTAKIKAIDLLKQSYTYLNELYGTTGATFQPSSPTGQILSVVANISELIFLYLEHAASELNIMRAQTTESVQGLSRLTGHDPFRGSAASGMCKIKINPSSIQDFEGNYVKIYNGTTFVIDETGNQYFLNLNTDYIMVETNSEPVNIEFVQGVKAEQSFVADGKKLQSYNVNTKGMTDHNRVRVFVDNVEWKRVESLYDMNYDEECYMIKTSVNMGLSVFFGNKDFGKCPESGKQIRVEYINHIGLSGNMTGESLHFNFNMFGVDENGENVDLNKILSVEVEKNPSMGASYEPIELTRRIAPHMSKSFVLANPDNYTAFLSKYSQFSYVEAYNTKDDNYTDDDNVIYLRITPNIKDKVTKQTDSVDYFSLPENEFVLSETEKEGIIKILDDSGRQLVSSEVVIEDTEVNRYALVIALKYFERADKNQVWSDIRSKLNKYFLNISRTDMIPKSDIVAMVESIDGVDGVNVYFISEKNEDAIRNGYYIDRYEWINPATHLRETVTKRVDLNDGEDPRLGLDNFGDIKLSKNEVAIIKGGWSDRHGNEFSTDLKPDSLCGLTVLFTAKTDDLLYNDLANKNFLNSLK